jgi:DNA-binding MarR family transcriptional regulator
MTIRVKNQFLLLLLSGVNEKKPKDIATQLGISKQNLNYHLQKLIKLNILYKEQSYPFAIYRLTDLGERVKNSLRQSENPKPLWRVHNLIVGFRILNLGSFNFVETTRRKLIRMRNWNYAREEMDGYVINVQDTGLLKIYVPSKYTKDPDLAIGEMISEADRIAADYINRYDMKLQRMEIVRKAEKELQNSEVLAKIFGRIKTDGIYVNESDGFEALEEKQDSYIIEDLLKLPIKVADLEKHLIRQTEIMDQFSKNIELHLAVLSEIRDAVKKLGGN